jgi:hypothetical protein
VLLVPGDAKDQRQRGRHGERAGQGDPDQQATVEQRLIPGSRWDGHGIRLLRLALEGHRRRDVDEELHPQDLEWKEGEADPGQCGN